MFGAGSPQRGGVERRQAPRSRLLLGLHVRQVVRVLAVDGLPWILRGGERRRAVSSGVPEDDGGPIKGFKRSKSMLFREEETFLRE